MNPVPRPMDGWHTIPWTRSQRHVLKPQKRLDRAARRGDAHTVRSRQRLVRHACSAKRLSVRRVTQDNRGKRTAGVDGVRGLPPPNAWRWHRPSASTGPRLPSAESGCPNPARRRHQAPGACLPWPIAPATRWAKARWNRQGKRALPPTALASDRGAPVMTRASLCARPWASKPRTYWTPPAQTASTAAHRTRSWPQSSRVHGCVGPCGHGSKPEFSTTARFCRPRPGRGKAARAHRDGPILRSTAWRRPSPRLCHVGAPNTGRLPPSWSRLMTACSSLRTAPWWSAVSRWSPRGSAPWG
jgi:hypothetical protein